MHRGHPYPPRAHALRERRPDREAGRVRVVVRQQRDDLLLGPRGDPFHPAADVVRLAQPLQVAPGHRQVQRGVRGQQVGRRGPCAFQPLLPAAAPHIVGSKLAEISF